jgi:hypothetical protein
VVPRPDPSLVHDRAEPVPFRLVGEHAASDAGRVEGVGGPGQRQWGWERDGRHGRRRTRPARPTSRRRAAGPDALPQVSGSCLACSGLHNEGVHFAHGQEG